MQVTEHIHALRIPFTLPIGPGITLDRFVYAFLIFGEDICLIDTGVASSKQVIFDYILSTGRNPEEISTIVQTHTHPDHIGATKAIKEACGCILAVHAGEQEWIEDVELQFKERPIPGFHLLVGGSVEVDQVLADGDVLNLGKGLTLEVFHTPGHSKGSISLLLKEDRALFSGDVIPLPGDVLIYEDYLASVDSVKKLLGIEGVNNLFSSWDQPREGETIYRLLNDSLNYFQHVDELVAKHYKNGVTDTMDLCKRVFQDLGIPTAAAIPTVAKSFEANIKVLKK